MSAYAAKTSHKAKQVKSGVAKSTKSHHDHEHEELFRKAYIQKGDVLSVTDCVSIAFNNSPVIRRYKYQLDVAKSNVGIAKSEYFPVIGAGVGFTNINNQNQVDYDRHYREFPSVAVTINKLVWDFGKTTSLIKMEEFYKIGAEYEFVDSLCETLFNVKEKYYALLFAKSKLAVEKKDYELNEELLDLAEKIAAKDPSRRADVSSARLNLGVARVRYHQAVNDYKNAKIDLNNAMWVEQPEEYTIKSTDTYSYNNEFIDTTALKEFIPEKLPFDMKTAPEIAYKNSPDLKVLIATFKAMEQSLNYIKRTYFPELKANAGYGFNNTNREKSNNSWVVGVSMESSVNLMNLRHSIKGADAQLNIADNEIVLFKKNLYYKVNRALNNLTKAELEFPITQVSAANAYNHLQIVMDDYEHQKENYVAMQTARTNYHAALIAYIEALYAYNTALINVERATHSHLIDIHHKGEHAVHYHSNELVEHVTKWLNCDEKEKRKRIRKEYQL
jgi:outer membrane protein TolC